MRPETSLSDMLTDMTIPKSRFKSILGWLSYPVAFLVSILISTNGKLKAEASHYFASTLWVGALFFNCMTCRSYMWVYIVFKSISQWYQYCCHRNEGVYPRTMSMFPKTFYVWTLLLKVIFHGLFSWILTTRLLSCRFSSQCCFLYRLNFLAVFLRFWAFPKHGFTLGTDWVLKNLTFDMSMFTKDIVNQDTVVMMPSSNGNICRVTQWPFVRGIRRSPVDSPHNGQWRGALMFSLIWTKDWVSNRNAGDLRSRHAHYDVTVMNHAMPSNIVSTHCQHWILS